MKDYLFRKKWFIKKGKGVRSCQLKYQNTNIANFGDEQL